MKLSLWRPSYLTHVQKLVKVSSWSIDKPTADVLWTTGYNFAGNSVGYLPTLREVNYSPNDSSRDIIGSAIQDLYVLVRLDKGIPYHSLPLARLEGVHATYSVITSLEWRTILPPEVGNRGLLGLDFLSCNPVTLCPAGDFNSDYIAELVWSVRIRFVADPETGILPAPYSVNRIGGKVYRSKLNDFADNIIDFNSLLKKED